MSELRTRKKNRLEGYDYSRNGAYFITVCVKDGHEILWDKKPVGAAFGRPPLSKVGVLIDAAINKVEDVYDSVKIDHYVIMPNHVHIIIAIDSSGRPKAAPTISRILNQFKGSITKQLGYSIWQKLFHDHIIRDEAEYKRIWQYIDENPARWAEDCYYTV